MKDRLDRWRRKPDLRDTFADLTEDEALFLRALFESDQNYVRHLTPTKIRAAQASLVKKGYIKPP